MLIARVVFPGETPETDSAICFDTSDLRRLLLHRLEVLEAALQRISELRCEAANALAGHEATAQLPDTR